MKGRVSVLVAGAIVAGLVLFSAGDTRAGLGASPWAFCNQTPGTSFCMGSFAGFIQDSHPDSYAGFSTGVNGNSFGATLAGQHYSCVVSSALYPQVAALWPQINSFKGLFFIYWDAQGFCSMLEFFHSSNNQ